MKFDIHIEVDAPGILSAEEMEEEVRYSLERQDTAYDVVITKLEVEKLDE